MFKWVLISLIIVSFISIDFYLSRNRSLDNRPTIPPSPTNNLKLQVGPPAPFSLKVKEGFEIGVFAQNLGNARDLEFSPGGTLLTSVPNSGKVYALPDKDNNAQADEIKEILSHLNKPHGLAFYGNKLYVAQESKVTRFNWEEETLSAKEERILLSLPSGGRHFTRSIVFDKEGRMFVSIGSTCDVCFEKHEWLGSIIISDSEGNNPRLFAKGLRNSVFIAINPKTNELWGTEMGRDFLGDDKPPDEINLIKEGKDYGWPTCFGNKVKDTNFSTQPRKVGPCEATEAPIYEIAAHSAPLGLTFIDSKQFRDEWQGDLLVAYHGSWNRSTPIGYKVVRLKLERDSIVGEEDFLGGFLEESTTLGRPVDVVFDHLGSLYISDDKTGAVYKIVMN